MASNLIPLEELGDDKKEGDIDPFYEYLYSMYAKVGNYNNWSFNEFMETPWSMIEWSSKDIDKKLIPYASMSDDGPPGPMPYSHFHLALLLALSRLFGGGDETEIL